MLPTLLRGAPAVAGIEPRAPEAGSDSLRVSLITCYPGPEVYELCGHEALRIRTATTDSVWNYGVFDFNAPGFVVRYVKGETDYMLAGYPFAWFMPEYERRGSRVVEQELNLTQAEAMRLREIVRTKALPANRTYRYNYVLDNCATRIVANVDSALGTPALYPDSLRFPTFREAMRYYHRNYPWYQFGIDLALGPGIDRRITPREEMFAPIRMLPLAAGAKRPDGRPLVKAERVLLDGGDAGEGPTPWWAGPLFWSWVAFAACVSVAVADIRRRRLLRPVYCVWFALTGLAGCLLTFLVFVSVHEATSPNLLIWWLNPLGLLLAAGLWWRKLSRAEGVLMVVNVLSVACLLLAWPFGAQSANPAFFPLMGCSIALSASGAVVLLSAPRCEPPAAVAPAAKRNAPRKRPTQKKKKI